MSSLIAFHHDKTSTNTTKDKIRGRVSHSLLYDSCSTALYHIIMSGFQLHLVVRNISSGSRSLSLVSRHLLSKSNGRKTTESVSTSYSTMRTTGGIHDEATATNATISAKCITSAAGAATTAARTWSSSSFPLLQQQEQPHKYQFGHAADGSTQRASFATLATTADDDPGGEEESTSSNSPPLDDATTSCRKHLEIPPDQFAIGCQLLQQAALGNLSQMKSIVNNHPYDDGQEFLANFRDYDRRTAL